jgi:hypothetical protein
LVAPPFREPGRRDPLEAVKVLLAAGADPNAKVSDGSTPLHQAVQIQQVPIIRALVAAGGALDVGNKDKLTPLGLAEKLMNTPAPPSTTNNEEEGYRPKRNSREEVVAALREIMHLGPNDPVPAPLPTLDDKTEQKGNDQKGNDQKGKGGNQGKGNPATPAAQ